MHMNMIDYGWDREREAEFEAFVGPGLVPGRVVKQARDLSTLVTPVGELAAEVTGRFRRAAAGPADFPVVGDWAVVEPVGGGPAIIHALLSRRSAFARKVAGEEVEAQVAAANVDTVFLVSGLDGDLNLRRIERYLATALESGAAPVVVLNKADLRQDLDDIAAEVSSVAPGVPVAAVSAMAESGLAALEPYLVPRRTVALLGSSGVGKSTIINRLLGEERFRTSSMSDAAAGRGRHTTTSRELVRLPSGALLIDTPGIRELQLWSGEEGLERAFEDIEELAVRCRFPDCRHEHEPGCAVRAAARDGCLDARRLESYLKLRREIRFMEIKKDAKARRRQEKVAGRDFAARLKEVKRNKPRYR